MRKKTIKLLFISFIQCMCTVMGICDIATNALAGDENTNSVVVRTSVTDIAETNGLSNLAKTEHSVITDVDKVVDAAEKERLLSLYDGNMTNTVITADYMEYDYSKMTAELKGTVCIKDSRIYMESDLIRVFFYKDNGIKSISALGNVKVVQGNKIALANRAIYFGNEGKIIMLGKAVLLRDDEYMKGQRITFFIDNQRVICEPGVLVFRPANYNGENPIISTNEAAMFDEFRK